MEKFMIFTICVVVAMAFAMPSHAQRLIPKQQGIEIMVSVPILKRKSSLPKITLGWAYRSLVIYDVQTTPFYQQNMNSRTCLISTTACRCVMLYCSSVICNRYSRIGRRISLATWVSLPSVVMRNWMRIRSSCLMGQLSLTVHASSMAEPCIVQWNSSLRIIFSLSSKHKGDCSSAPMCIVFVLHFQQDSSLIFKQQKQWRKKY